jgi:hypothetical protein
MKPTLLLATALAAFTFSDAAWAASMHTMVFTSSGTFTIPATAAAGTEFEFTVIGGGGGGGGCSTGIFQAASGGSGGAGFASYSGFTASQTVAVTIGAGGTGGAFGGGAGGGGATSKLVFGTTTIAQSTGGGGSPGQTAGTMVAGTAGAFSAAAGVSGLTLATKLDYGAEEGTVFPFSGIGNWTFTIPGGGNPLGHAGTVNSLNGVLGGGGMGCQYNGVPGGTGGAGVVIVRWAV